VVWWFFTKDVPFSKLDEIRAILNAEPDTKRESMAKRITQLGLAGGQTVVVGGGE
jgi:hypothetical protein